MSRTVPLFQHSFFLRNDVYELDVAKRRNPQGRYVPDDWTDRANLDSVHDVLQASVDEKPILIHSVPLFLLDGGDRDDVRVSGRSLSYATTVLINIIDTHRHAINRGHESVEARLLDAGAAALTLPSKWNSGYEYR